MVTVEILEVSEIEDHLDGTFRRVTFKIIESNEIIKARVPTPFTRAKLKAKIGAIMKRVKPKPKHPLEGKQYVFQGA